MSEALIEEVEQLPIGDPIPRADERFLGFAIIYADVSDKEVSEFARSAGVSRVVVNRTYSMARWCIGTPPPGWQSKFPVSRLQFFARAGTANVSGYPPQWANQCRAELQRTESRVPPGRVVIADHASVHPLPARNGDHGWLAQIDLADWDESLRPALADFAGAYGCDQVILWDRRQTSLPNTPSANPNLVKSILLYRVISPNPKLANLQSSP